MGKKELESEVRSLEFKLSHLGDRFELKTPAATIEKIGYGVRTYSEQLAELERRGFLHTLPIKKILEQIKDDWTSSREKQVRQELQTLQKKLTRGKSRIDAQVRGLKKPSKPKIESVEAAIKAFGDEISDAENRLGTLFRESSSHISQVASQMKQVEWMLEQLDESPDINMLENEGPLLAVEAEWENEGDEGPDGILYLTDQRIIFEEKAEKATKKFLFITRESELVQQLLIAEPVSEIQEVAHSEERRQRLRLRKDDLLDLVMSSHAAHSRLRFHIRGEESKDWAVMINRVMAGDVFKDRAKVAQTDEANVQNRSFPAECPDCFAPIPPQPRGGSSVICEFCRSTIQSS